MKNVIVISTSPRGQGNSELLADEFVRGAKEANHNVEKITLHDKRINFCKGCFACQHTKTGHCVVQDDIDEIVHKIGKADVIAFATPIYFYEMCGQMKTLLDRTNPLFCIAYAFRDVYLLASAADDERNAVDGAIKGLTGWIDCFKQASLKGVVYGTGVDDVKAVLSHPEHLNEAFAMGKGV